MSKLILAPGADFSRHGTAYNYNKSHKHIQCLCMIMILNC